MDTVKIGNVLYTFDPDLKPPKVIKTFEKRKDAIGFEWAPQPGQRYLVEYLDVAWMPQPPTAPGANYAGVGGLQEGAYLFRVRALVGATVGPPSDPLEGHTLNWHTMSGAGLLPTRLGITDDRLPARAITLLSSLGLGGLRGWLGVDASGACTTAPILRANAFIGAGLRCKLVMEPQRKPVRPVKACALVTGTLSKKVHVNVVNEAGSPGYSFPGDWMAAHVWADDAAKMLPDHSLGTPSHVGYYDQWPDRFTKLKSLGLLDRFQRACFHIYVGYESGFNIMKDYKAWFAKYEWCLQQAVRVREITGLQLDLDETGLGWDVSDEVAAQAYHDQWELHKRYGVDYSIFIITNEHRDPHQRFPWVKDWTTGAYRDKIADALKGLK